MNYSDLTLVAIQAALHAGNILRTGYGSVCEITRKPGAHNIVTQFDHAAEQAIIQTIKSNFPNHSILAEESGSHSGTLDSSGDNSVLWIIDPLDGTTNFAQNIPLFAVSIGASVQGSLAMGVIYAPVTNELFVAQKGVGAYLNGKKLQVSRQQNLSQAILSAGFPYPEDLNTMWMDQFLKIVQLGNPMRELGSAAMNLAYIAAGRLDAYWIASLQPWDIAAGQLLVEEAGGAVTQCDGTPIDLRISSSLLATNGRLQDQILNLLAQAS